MSNQTQGGQSVHPEEYFQLNETLLAGRVTRLWSWNRDVFTRLVIPHPLGVENGAANHVTLKFPGGKVNARPVSLQRGAWIAVQGCLVDQPYFETGASYLTHLTPEQLRGVPQTILDLAVPRIATQVLVLSLQPSPDSVARNEAQVEGIVARVWSYGGHPYARLAIYDRQTQVVAGQRQAHYVSVKLLEKTVIKKGGRLRVSGELWSIPYATRLADVMGRADPNCPLSGELSAIKKTSTSLYVVAREQIVF